MTEVEYLAQSALALVVLNDGALYFKRTLDYLVHMLGAAALFKQGEQLRVARKRHFDRLGKTV